MKNMSIGTKLIGAFTIVALMAGGAGVIGIAKVKSVYQVAEGVQKDKVPVVAAALNMKAAVQAERSAILELVMGGEDAREELAQAGKAFDDVLRSIEDAEESDRAKSLDADHARLMSSTFDGIDKGYTALLDASEVRTKTIEEIHVTGAALLAAATGGGLDGAKIQIIFDEVMAVHDYIVVGGGVAGRSVYEASRKTIEGWGASSPVAAAHADLMEVAEAVFAAQDTYQEADVALEAALDAAETASIELGDKLDDFVTEAQNHMDREMARAKRTEVRSLWSMGGVAVGAFVIALLAGATISRSITGRLQQFVDDAHLVGEGDLTVRVGGQEGGDEIASLARAFQRMIDGLRKQTCEVLEGIQVLGSSASELSGSVGQLASGSTQTASAVSETATTVEEVRQTAQVAAERARDVSQNSQRMAQIAQAGQKASSESLEQMGRIREQMESMADSIVSLSEQSQSIGEIISSVDDLAEQSNLLAVNAAVEAAKAGEQGKGFAVVAQEIKSLSERSRQATAQVRSILGDIQKATGAAVMATEQGAKAVEAGVQQSAGAGEAIEDLARSAASAAQAATQIAASAQEQFVGIDQVTQAMDSIKQAADQSVVSTQQFEAVASGLQELGEKLEALTSRYTV